MSYMLKQVSNDPEKIQKRLGDGFYEQKLIREQITELTGRRFLDGYSSDEEQYKALMTNGALYAQALQLKVGVALTAEQMAQRTSDIVWLVEQEVEGEKVLVPVIYLAQVQAGDLKPNGALMAAKDIQILANGNLTNTGVIKADNRNQISANNITNRGGVIAGGVTELTAVQDIVNQSGSISGNDVQLTAGRDVINETVTATVNRDHLSTTLVSQQSNIEAKGSLTVQAGRDISVAGAQVTAGGDLSLQAGRTIDIGAVEHTSRAAFAYPGTNFERAVTTNIGSAIQAGGDAHIASQGDLNVRGAKINAGDDLTLVAGGSIGVTAVKDRAMQNVEIGNRGSKYYRHTMTDDETVIGSSLTAQNQVTIAAVQSGAEQANLNRGNVTVEGGTIASSAGKIALLADNDVTFKSIASFSSTSSSQSQTIKGSTTDINASHNLAIQAGRDISITGAQVNAGQDVTMNAGRNLTVDSVQQEQRVSAGNYLKDTVSNVVSNINAGNNVTLTATGDATLRGAQVSAGSNLALLAGGNITVAAVKDEQIEDKTVGIRRGWQRTMTDDETVIGSTLQGGGQVTIAAVQLPGGASGSQQDRGNVTIAGSNIISKTGGVTIAADKDVTVEAVTEKHESLVISHTKKKGTFSSKTTDTRDYSLVNEVVGSTISGEAVTVQSGNDLTVKASNLVATNDLNLTAGNNLTITSAAETGAEDHYKKTKKSGLFGGGGFGFTIGKKSEKSTESVHTLAEVGSTIGSLQGNVTLLAGNQVTSQGTTMVSAKDLNITGKAVAIDNTINTYDSLSKYEVKQSGLSVSLGGGSVIGKAVSAAGNIERASEVKDDRLKGLYAYKAAKDIGDLSSTAQQGGLTGESIAKSISINVSIGSSKQTSEQTVHAETVNTSNINAGGRVNIIATAGDVTMTGVKLNAGDVAIQAAKDINLNAAQNKQQIDSKTTSSSWAIGGSIGIGGSAGTGYFANASSGSSKEHENTVANVGSVINASGTVQLASGNDLNIIGSQVKGDKVIANIGGKPEYR